jgi:hypothetical protein
MNAWFIDTQNICAESGRCTHDADGNRFDLRAQFTLKYSNCAVRLSMSAPFASAGADG